MRQAFGIAAVGVALLIFATALGFGDVLGWVLGPLGLAALGGAFIWREADDARRARWRRTAAGIVGPSKASLWRLVGGCALVIGGLSVFALGQLDFVAVRSALIGGAADAGRRRDHHDPVVVAARPRPRRRAARPRAGA